jgi:hypothetical protein
MRSRRLLRAHAVAGASLLALGVWAFSETLENTPRGNASAGLSASGTNGRLDSAAGSIWSGIAGAALPPSEAGADPLQVEPRVPRAAGTPCVVEMTRNFLIPELWYWSSFVYTPPTSCPGPYAKITLVVELTGPRQSGQPSSTIQFFLGALNGEGTDLTSGALFAGAPQITDDIGVWRMERDVTEYAALFKAPLNGYFPGGAFDNYNHDGEFLDVSVRSLKLVFFPATAATPAQRVADVVLPLQEPYAWEGVATLTTVFPRNTERLYADILAKPTRYWYSCAPLDSWQAFPVLYNGYAIGDYRYNTANPRQGCGGGSFREVEVLIDGQLAGLAPAYPWLGSNISNIFRSTVDSPAPSVQALNMMPFRVDLTPFAGLLNDGTEHTVQARMAGGAYGFVSGNLTLYLDKGRAVVPGAVTRNTLAAQPAAPAVTNGLVQTIDSSDGPTFYHVTGQVSTRSTRAFRIEGYVDTSRGRITSTVIQSNRFANTLTYDVRSMMPDPFGDYDADFLQKVRLSSTVDRTSRRMLGTTLLSEDKLYSSYPLILDFHHAGENRSDDEFGYTHTNVFSVRIHQARGLRTSQYRRGTPRYETSLADIFDASRDYFTPVLGGVGDANWASRRSYLFTDNRAGCYSAGLTTANRTLTSRTRGEACPNGRNGLRWYSHPDGSPDAMGWAPEP